MGSRSSVGQPPAWKSLLFRATESGGRLADVLDDDAERVEELVRAFRALVDDGVFARPLDGSHGGR